MKSEYDVEFERLLNLSEARKYFIKRSNASFKIKLFIQKAKNSFMLIDWVLKCPDIKSIFLNYWIITISYYSMLYAAKAAILTKGYETDDHYAAQIALAHLLVPDEIEKADLELLEQSYKIFEEEYVEYFEDARKESNTARYAAIKKYSERRVKEIMDNTKKFIAKIELIIEK